MPHGCYYLVCTRRCTPAQPPTCARQFETVQCSHLLDPSSCFFSLLRPIHRAWPERLRGAACQQGVRVLQFLRGDMVNSVLQWECGLARRVELSAEYLTQPPSCFLPEFSCFLYLPSLLLPLADVSSHVLPVLFSPSAMLMIY